MKPTSIIFLIVSVLLACVGLLLCFTATSIAANEGTAIFSQTGSAETGYNYTTSFTFDETKTAQISFDLGDVDVFVCPTSDQSRIELVNFPEGTYKYAETKTSVKITDNASLENMLDLENFQINFNGFRDYLHWYRYRNNRKAVYLYIGNPEHLTKISIASEGNITVDGTAAEKSSFLELGDTDCEFTTRGGDFTVTAFRSNSLLRLEATEEAILTLDSVSVNTLEVYGVNAFAELKDVKADYSTFIEINQGTVEYTPGSFNLSDFDLIFNAKNGSVRYLGNIVRNGVFEQYNYSETHSTADPGAGEETGEAETGEEAGESETGDETEQTEEATTDSQGYKVTPNSVIIVVKNGDITIK